MNKPLLLAGAIALALSGTAFAQEQAQEAPAAEIHSPEATDYDLRVTDLMGKEVRNARNEDIGDVEDLVVAQDGQVLAILSVGGLLGLGEKLVAVPYRQLQPGPAEEDFVFYPGTEEQLEALPEFTFREGTAIWNINDIAAAPAPTGQAAAPAPAAPAAAAPAPVAQPALNPAEMSPAPGDAPLSETRADVESPAETQAPAEQVPVETNP